MVSLPRDRTNLIRMILNLVFLFAYVLVAFWRNYTKPFELVSDFGQYYNHFNEGGIFDFGVEFLVPFLFYFSRDLGIGFYDFTFLYCLFYLIPIFLISRRVVLILLPFYFLFFLVWFIPNNIFLLRQYTSFYFLILFFLAGGIGVKFKIILAFFSILSHLSAIIFLFFSFLSVKRKSVYLVFAAFSVALFFLQNSLFSLKDFVLNILQWLLYFDFGDGFKRKVDGQFVILNDLDHSEVSSLKNIYVILVALIIHSFKIYFLGENDKLMKLFFFTSIFALMFSGFVVLSNRLGFAAYFFSIPYLILVLSCYRITRSYAIGFRADYDSIRMSKN